MADSLTELLQAVDTYMASNAKNKTAGPYLATKLAAVFEDPNSIFNPSGIVKTIGDKLSKTFADMDAELNTFKKSLTAINKTNISSIFAKSMNSLVGFSSSLGKFNTKLYDAGKILPKLNTNSIDTVLGSFIKKIANLNTINLYSSFDTLNQTLVKFTKILVDTGIEIEKTSVPRNGFVLPASLNATPKERTLESHDIVDVNIVKINDNVASRFGKSDKKGGMFNNFFGQQDSFRSDSRNGAKGFMGKIFDWLKSILFWGLAIFGGAFLLGKIKKFLDETPLGQKIKADIKEFGSMLFKKITDYINTGDLGKTISNGIKFAMNILRKVILNAVEFYAANETAIKGIIDDVWNTIRNEIVEPLYDTFIQPFFAEMKARFSKIDWSETVEKAITWFKEKVIDPIWNNISADFNKGDNAEAWTKIALLGTALGLLINKITGGGGLLAATAILITGLRGLIGAIGSVGGIGGVGLIASVVALGIAIKKARGVADEATENKKVHAKLGEIADKQLSVVEKRLAELEQKKAQLPATPQTVKEEAERNILDAQINIQKLNAEAEKHNKLFNEQSIKNNTWIEKIKNIAGTPIAAAVAGLVGKSLNNASDEMAKKTKAYQEEYNRNYKLIDYWKKKLDVEPNKDKPLQLPTPKLSPFDSGALAVEPDRPEQNKTIGKPQEPLASKETLKKLDNITQVFAEGVTMIMQASVQGSQQIVGAIASTNKGASQATTGGGMDNIGAYRDRVARALNG